MAYLRGYWLYYRLLLIFEPDDSSRIGHLTTLILAQIASLYIVDSSLPKLSFFTLLDVYVLCSFLLTVFITISSCGIYLIQDDDKQLKRDFYSLYICIGYAVLYHIFMVFKYCQMIRRDEGDEEIDKLLERQLAVMRYVDEENEIQEIEGVKMGWVLVNYEFSKK